MRRRPACGLVAAVLLLSGCGGSPTPVGGSGGGGTDSTGGISGPAITGAVQVGTAPLSGASVQLYAAGTSGNGSAGTALGSAQTTDANGRFSIAAGSYTCASSTAVLYLVATDGAGTTVLMNSPGTCGVAAATVVLNERTTAASAWALRPFLSDGARLGSTATNVTGLTLAVGTLGSLVNVTTGAAPGSSFPANSEAPTAKIDSLANALHACASDATVCADLFTAAAMGGVTSANTLEAALHVVSQPAANVSTLFALSQRAPVFTPTLTSAPAEWTLPVVFMGGGLKQPTALSFDANGQLWVANFGGGASLFTHLGAPVFASGVTGYGLQSSYGGAVDASGNFWVANQQSDPSVNNGAGSVTVLAASGGTLTRMQQIATGGLNFPSALGFSRSGMAWVTNLGDASVTLLGTDGSPQSGAAGYTVSTLSFPDAVAVDAQGNGWIGNMSLPAVAKLSASGAAAGSFTVGGYQSAVAIDASDNVWTANYSESTAGLVSVAGAVVSGAGFTGGGLSSPAGLAIDGAGNAWISNYGSSGVTELAGAASAQPGAALSPTAGWASDTKIAKGFAVAIDAAGSVWVTDFANSTVTELVGAAAPVKTPLLGPVQVP